MSTFKKLLLAKEEREEFEALRIENSDLLTQVEGLKELNRIQRERNEDLQNRMRYYTDEAGYSI